MTSAGSFRQFVFGDEHVFGSEVNQAISMKMPESHPHLLVLLNGQAGSSLPGMKQISDRFKLDTSGNHPSKSNTRPSV